MFVLGVSPSVMKIPDSVEQNAKEAFHNWRKQSQEEKALLACNFKRPSTQAIKALMIFNVFIIFSVKPSILRA